MSVFVGRVESKLVDRMGVLQAESRVIANNIANANVNTYTAKRVDFSRLIEEEYMRLNLVTTHPRHISGKNHIDQGNQVPILDTGRKVELDEEIVRMTENALDYQTMVRLLKSRFDLFANIISERVE